MSTRSSTPSPAAGPDILVRYLQAYVSARKLSDLERPWGLGDEGLDALWRRLIDSLASDPNSLGRIIAEELSDEDREHIVATIAPLIFALPIRTYPAEVDALRSGSQLNLFVHSGNAVECPDEDDQENEMQGKSSKHSGKHPKKTADGQPYPLGHIPAALTGPLVKYLRRVLHLGPKGRSREVSISSGGRRRRIHVEILQRNRGVKIRFLDALPPQSPELTR